jgi:TrmH family RNA methyltransferase
LVISSIQNPKIKWIRDLQEHNRARRQEGAFVVEGVRLAEEALQANWKALFTLYTPDLSERGKTLLDGLTTQGAPVEETTSQVIRHCSDTETPQGLLVVLEWQPLPPPAKIDFAFIPDLVRDPGNLGTMLRTAQAAGVQVVFVPPATVDPLSPKVIRAGMGAHFHLPILIQDWEEITSLLRSMHVYLAESSLGIPYSDADFHKPLALVLGGESEGAGPQARRLASTQVHIPMPGGSESLNAAVAAGILLFEVVKQRRGMLQEPRSAGMKNAVTG